MRWLSRTPHCGWGPSPLSYHIAHTLSFASFFNALQPVKQPSAGFPSAPPIAAAPASAIPSLYICPITQVR
jgi:hypothetical protein